MSKKNKSISNYEPSITKDDNESRNSQFVIRNSKIPELRFPEFKNEGEWDNVVLGRISEIVRGGSPRPIQDYTTTDLNGLNWLKIADVPSDSKYITETKERVIKEAINSTREVNSGDLILSNSMSFGRPYILKITTCIHDGWIAIRKISNRTFEDYLYYFISSESCQSYFQTNAAGAAVKNLNAEIIKLLPIYLPKNKQEQQKIASCLSSLDEVIAAHSQKLELLKDHKKGLMQNLFPTNSITNYESSITNEDDQFVIRNSQTRNLPKYRFKEFEEDGEWVEKKLGELAELTSSKRVHLADYVSSGVPFFRGKEISQLKNNQFPDDILYISNEQYKEIKDKYGVPKKGDILITAVGTLGNVYCIKNDDEFYFKDGNLIWMKNISIDSHFLDVLLDVEKEKVLASAIGSSQKALTMAALNKIEFQIPRNPKEQQKIAACLSSLDVLITAQAEKIAQLQLHKKGLMQGLFPKSITN